ncbi:hypothetical protein CCP3SC1AL1_320015 [Gammaproteobacteria bacterium]
MADTLLNTLQEVSDIEPQILEDLGLVPDAIYFVTITASGADEDLGIKGTETQKRTKAKPNPKVKTLSLSKVAQSGGYFQIGDIEAILSANNYTKAFLETVQYYQYQNQLYKVLKVDGVPEISTPLQWKVLLRKHSG